MTFANIVFVAMTVACLFGAYQLYCMHTGKLTKRILRNVHRLTDSLLAMNRRTSSERQDWVGQMNLWYGVITVVFCLVAVYFGAIHVCIPLIAAFGITRESNAMYLRLVEADVANLEESANTIKRDIMEGCRNLDLSNISANVDRL